MAFSLFVPKAGSSLWLYIIGTILIGCAFLFMLTLVPSKFRKPIVIGITFVSGWFYFLEFVIPGSGITAPARQELSAADQQLSLANNDLMVLTREKAKIDPSRVQLANKRVESAVNHLQKAAASLKAEMPNIQKELNSSADRADGFAKKNNLSDKMVDRMPVNGRLVIADVSTNTLNMTLNNVGGAYNAIMKGDKEQNAPSFIDALSSVQAALSTGDKKQIAASAGAVAYVMGGIGGVETTISDNSLTPYKEPLAVILTVVGAFSLALGIINLLSIHGKAVMKRRPGWINSFAFYAAFIIMAVVGLLMKYASPKGAGSLGKALYDILFQGGLTALSATMFSLVAFYIVSAAYRAFRIRSGEAALMMIAAFIVMLSIVPFGVWLTHGIPPQYAFLRLQNLGDWIMTIPNAAAQRGMAFGIGVGGLAMALRIWFSLERGSYFDKQM